MSYLTVIYITITNGLKRSLNWKNNKIDVEKRFLQNKKIFNKKLKRNWLYLVVSNPEAYFLKLFYQTLFIGFFTASMIYLYKKTGMNGTIPENVHSIGGIVLGLLLVFRFNRAYDRLVEGGKNLELIKNSLNFFIFKYKVSVNSRSKDDEIVQSISNMLFNLKKYLLIKNPVKSQPFLEEKNKEIVNLLTTIQYLRNDEQLDHKDSQPLETCIQNIINSVGSCERIKNNPIPLSYGLHIKISTFIYILTLPFGLFADMSIISASIVVMVIFYIVAGVEIISSEIENPFEGEPNDLPLEEFFSSLNDFVKSNLGSGELKTRILEAREEIKKGNFTSHEDLKNESKSW